MAMSDEHKAALAAGRRQSRAIKEYLAALQARKPGRPVTKDSLEKRLAALEDKIQTEEDPLKRVDLVQQRLDVEKAIKELGDAADLSALEKGFVEHAKDYSSRKSISYSAWREAGVPADVLRKAGIARTRLT
jgi:hypothetical protein